MRYRLTRAHARAYDFSKKIDVKIRLARHLLSDLKQDLLKL